jgi:hypothetical protein
VHESHLFVLQVDRSRFGTSWWGEMAWHREAFHRLGVQDVAEFDSHGSVFISLVLVSSRRRIQARCKSSICIFNIQV